MNTAIQPFEGSECYSLLPLLAPPLFYNNFGTDVLRVQVNDLRSEELLVALADIPFMRGATRIQQTTVEVSPDRWQPWLRWPLLGRQRSLAQLRKADATYRASLVCNPQQWRELVKKMANDPQWGWYFRIG